MRDRLIEILNKADKRCDECKQCEQCVAFTKGEDCINYLIADTLLANGVIVPPVKVGDTVFLVSKDTRIFDNIKFVVSGFEIRSDGDNTYQAICTMNDNLIPITFGDDNIGKTVFLTKEEAEKALAERSGE